MVLRIMTSANWEISALYKTPILILNNLNSNWIISDNQILLLRYPLALE